MTAEMMEHYDRSQPSMKSVEIGGYYAIFEDDCWHRIRCEEFDSVTGMVTVLFIDHGDEDQRPLSDLRILDKKFCSLSAQVIFQHTYTHMTSNYNIHHYKKSNFFRLCVCV